MEMTTEVQCVHKINNITDSNVISFSREWTIRFGLSKNIDEVWRKEHLSIELQRLINIILAQFNGGPFCSNIVMSQTESESD